MPYPGLKKDDRRRNDLQTALWQEIPRKLHYSLPLRQYGPDSENDCPTGGQDTLGEYTMPPDPLPSPLQQFVNTVTTALDEGREEARLLPRVGEAMKALVARDNWLDPACARPHPQYYQQYLLYLDPKARFSVVSFVWAPGQQTPIHDHTVWGCVGMLRGEEREQHYTVAADGIPRPLGEERRLRPGEAVFVSPTLGDIHTVSNAQANQVSISIHAYGGNIGTIQRHVFPPEGGAPKNFVSGYANAATPT